MAIKGLLLPWIRDIVYTQYCTALNIVGAYVMYEEYYLAHFPFYAFFVIYIYICGVKCRVVFKVGKPEFPFDAQSDLWVGPTNINLLIANRISPIYAQIFTYFQQYFLIFIIIFAQSDLLVANINFPLFTQTYFLRYFLLCYISFSPMSKCEMQKS